MAARPVFCCESAQLELRMHCLMGYNPTPWLSDKIYYPKAKSGLLVRKTHQPSARLMHSSSCYVFLAQRRSASPFYSSDERQKEVFCSVKGGRRKMKLWKRWNKDCQSQCKGLWFGFSYTAFHTARESQF